MKKEQNTLKSHNLFYRIHCLWTITRPLHKLTKYAHVHWMYKCARYRYGVRYAHKNPSNWGHFEYSLYFMYNTYTQTHWGISVEMVLVMLHRRDMYTSGIIKHHIQFSFSLCMNVCVCVWVASVSVLGWPIVCVVADSPAWWMLSFATGKKRQEKCVRKMRKRQRWRHTPLVRLRVIDDDNGKQ